jgi:zinc transport system substrate-binding protein
MGSKGLFARALLAAAIILPGAGTAAAQAPRVVASIAPVHALVAGVMQGVGTPDLIVRGYGSPHGYQMRPSDAPSSSDRCAASPAGPGWSGCWRSRA